MHLPTQMRIKFKINPQKALEAILLLAEKKPGITFHTLLKVLYYADKKHLNKYGRPVIGDGYCALEFGPVGSFVYDLLKCEPIALEALQCDTPPFEIRKKYRVYGTRKADKSVFSASDLEAIKEAYRENHALGFGALTDKTHREKAWLEASTNGPMLYEDMLEGDAADPEAVRDLRQVGLRLVI
jgi:uncharacterized phage-associated protein